MISRLNHAGCFGARKFICVHLFTLRLFFSNLCRLRGYHHFKMVLAHQRMIHFHRIINHQLAAVSPTVLRTREVWVETVISAPIGV